MHFVDCETHLWGPMDDISYYPNFKKYSASAKAFGSILMDKRALLPENRVASAEKLVESMDEGDVAQACVLPEIMLGLSHGHRVRSTNGWVASEIDKYPERLIGIANVGPISLRGKDAIWELKYLVKEKGFQGCKVYPPDDCPLNDARNWPLFEAIQELGIVLFVHVGVSYLQPGNSTYCHPMLLEQVCSDFPDIPIVAYHMGYPYTRELILLGMMNENLYLSTSLLWQVTRASFSPAIFHEIIGEAIAYAGTGKLIWGTDWSGSYVSHMESADIVRNYQIPEEVQKRYGIQPLTDEDRAKWAGLNLAKLLKIK
ncbi:amidohydrolase family protein [Chloroflexota bacterium]